jgi:hypothetical protein
LTAAWAAADELKVELDAPTAPPLPLVLALVLVLVVLVVLVLLAGAVPGRYGA